MLTVYFQKEPWGEVSAMLYGETQMYSSVHELEAYCTELYGAAFELSEVTDENWTELYESGAFHRGAC
ncbi:hypothetical protein [Ferrimonas pelagia]|uniref:Uncharacterized protein n=1 Tax=Ferrimonas pelagia TaxID=1177826 RepID=A0ABP9F4L9_9GAMM